MANSPSTERRSVTTPNRKPVEDDLALGDSTLDFSDPTSAASAIKKLAIGASDLEEFESEEHQELDTPTDEGGETPESLEPASEEVDNELEGNPDDVPATAQTISFGPKGKEKKVTIEEAVKLLTKAEGADFKFRESAKVRSENKELKRQLEELSPYKTDWENLEKMNGDWSAIYSALSGGKKWEDHLEAEIAYRTKYKNAGPREKAMLDGERRIAEADRKTSIEKTKAEAAAKSSKDKATTEAKVEVTNWLESASAAHASLSDKQRKMVTLETLRDLAQYEKDGYQISRELAAKAFRKNAMEVSSEINAAVTKALKSETEKKKADAKGRAQIASTREPSESQATAKKGQGSLLKNINDFFMAQPRR